MSTGRSVRAPVGVILRDDSAIDLEASDYGQYMASGFDAKHLVLIPGETPTVFTIGQLTHAQRIYTEDMNEAGTRMKWAETVIRCQLLRVAGYKIEKPDGSTMLLDGEPERAAAGSLGSLITEKWMSEFAPTAQQVAGLAMSIRLQSEVRAPLSKPSAAPSGGSPSPSTTVTTPVSP